MNQTNGHTDSRYGTARQSLRSVTADTLELAKLQTRLFKLDALESLSKLRSGIILMIAGGLLILATVPVLLVAIGEAFIELAGWTRLAAYSASAGGSILVAAIMMAVAWRQLNRSGGGWQRSMDELQRNMDWLKSTLSGDEATPKQIDKDSSESASENFTREGEQSWQRQNPTHEILLNTQPKTVAILPSIRRQTW